LTLERPTRPLDLDLSIDRSRSPLDIELPLDRPTARAGDRRIPLERLAEDRSTKSYTAANPDYACDPTLSPPHGISLLGRAEDRRKPTVSLAMTRHP
jgi:hypothetical protein